MHAEIEKLQLKDLSARELVKEAARMWVFTARRWFPHYCSPSFPSGSPSRSIYATHDSTKDKDFELELSWVCAESKGLHQLVPSDLAKEAEQYAQDKMNEDSDDDD